MQRLNAKTRRVTSHIHLRAAEVGYVLTQFFEVNNTHTSTKQLPRQLGTRLPLLTNFDSNYSVVEVKKEEPRG